MQQSWRLRFFCLSGKLLPLLLQALDITGELLFGGPFSGGAHNDTRALGENLLQDRLEA